MSVRLNSKSHQKSSKCQNLLTDWHLELFGRNQLKNTPVEEGLTRKYHAISDLWSPYHASRGSQFLGPGTYSS